MEKEKKFSLALLLIAIIVLIIFLMRKSPTVSDSVNKVVNSVSDFVWPQAGAVTPLNYTPDVFNIVTGGYNSSGNPVINSSSNSGCSFCAEPSISTDVQIPASPRMQEQLLARETGNRVQPIIAHSSGSFGAVSFATSQASPFPRFPNLSGR